MTTSNRFEKGLEIIRKINPTASTNVLDGLQDVAPDFSKLMIELTFGDIFSRPGLDLMRREIAVIASLMTLGHATPQLRIHIQCALNVGVAREEIVEVIMQTAVYAGFPAALNAFAVAKEVFAANSSSATADVPATKDR